MIRGPFHTRARLLSHPCPGPFLETDSSGDGPRLPPEEISAAKGPQQVFSLECCLQFVVGLRQPVEPARARGRALLALRVPGTEQAIGKDPGNTGADAGVWGVSS